MSLQRAKQTIQEHYSQLGIAEDLPLLAKILLFAQGNPTEDFKDDYKLFARARKYMNEPTTPQEALNYCRRAWWIEEEDLLQIIMMSYYVQRKKLHEHNTFYEEDSSRPVYHALLKRNILSDLRDQIMGPVFNLNKHESLYFNHLINRQDYVSYIQEAPIDKLTIINTDIKHIKLSLFEKYFVYMKVINSLSFKTISCETGLSVKQIKNTWTQLNKKYSGGNNAT